MGATKAEQSPSPANFPQPEGTPNGFHHLTHKPTRQRTESIAEFYDRLGGVPLPLFVLQRGHHDIKDVFGLNQTQIGNLVTEVRRAGLIDTVVHRGYGLLDRVPRKSLDRDRIIATGAIREALSEKAEFDFMNYTGVDWTEIAQKAVANLEDLPAAEVITIPEDSAARSISRSGAVVNIAVSSNTSVAMAEGMISLAEINGSITSQISTDESDGETISFSSDDVSYVTDLMPYFDEETLVDIGDGLEEVDEEPKQAEPVRVIFTEEGVPSQVNVWFSLPEAQFQISQATKLSLGEIKVLTSYGLDNKQLQPREDEEGNLFVTPSQISYLIRTAEILKDILQTRAKQREVSSKNYPSEQDAPKTVREVKPAKEQPSSSSVVSETRTLTKPAARPEIRRKRKTTIHPPTEHHTFNAVQMHEALTRQDPEPTTASGDVYTAPIPHGNLTERMKERRRREIIENVRRRMSAEDEKELPVVDLQEVNRRIASAPQEYPIPPKELPPELKSVFKAAVESNIGRVQGAPRIPSEFFPLLASVSKEKLQELRASTQRQSALETVRFSEGVDYFAALGIRYTAWRIDHMNPRTFPIHPKQWWVPLFSADVQSVLDELQAREASGEKLTILDLYLQAKEPEFTALSKKKPEQATLALSSEDLS